MRHLVLRLDVQGQLGHNPKSTKRDYGARKSPPWRSRCNSTRLPSATTSWMAATEAPRTRWSSPEPWVPVAHAPAIEMSGIEAIFANATPVGATPRLVRCSRPGVTITVELTGSMWRLWQTVQQHQVTGGIDDPAKRVATSKGTYSAAASDNLTKGVYQFGLTVEIWHPGPTLPAQLCAAQRCSLPVDDPSKVFGGSPVRGRTRILIMAGEHLGPMSLSLSDHADIESGIQEFRGCELPQGENRAVEVEVGPARGLGRVPAVRRPPRPGSPTVHCDPIRHQFLDRTCHRSVGAQVSRLAGLGEPTAAAAMPRLQGR